MIDKTMPETIVVSGFVTCHYKIVNFSYYEV